MTISCDICCFAAGSIRCGEHILNYGVVRELHQAILGGGLWGDILYEEEQEAIAAEAPAETAARLMKVEKQDEKTADNLKEYHLQQLVRQHTDTKTGVLKHKTGRCCRDAEEPAKWVVGKRKLGNYKEWTAKDPKATKKPTVRPAGVPADAIFWSYGCEPHAKGCCPHLHPGETGYEEVKSGKKNAFAEAIMNKAVYLSTKPAVKPSPLKQEVMLDAW